MQYNALTVMKKVWLERTRSDHHHGGPGWELGTCLWSPSTDRGGSDRYRVMRDPQIGDAVIHLVDSVLIGQSVVASPWRTINEEPLTPGPWAGSGPYYRIDLRDYKSFATPCQLSKLMRTFSEDIRNDIRVHAPARYPFFVSKSGVLFPVQGAYLTSCSPVLVELIHRGTVSG